MLDKEAARQIALERIEHLAKTSGRRYVIIEDGVREHPLAWIFPFNSEEYAATRNRMKLVLGIAPIIVKRKTGEARMGRPYRFNEYLEEYLAEDEITPPAMA